MPDVAVLFDQDIPARKRVQYAVVLNVGARLDGQPTDVSAQARPRPHEATRADDDVADQHCVGMNVRRRINDGPDTFEFVAGHGLNGDRPDGSLTVVAPVLRAAPETHRRFSLDATLKSAFRRSTCQEC